MDPSLAPQPKRLFFDGTLSIYHYLCLKIAPWRHHSLCIRSAPGSTIWWDLQGGTPQNRPTTHHSTCAAIRALPRNSNLRSLIAPYDTPDVRCRSCLPSIEGNPSAIVQKKASNVTSIQSEWIWTTYSQTALHSLGGSETPQSWPAKCIHGRLGAYLAKHWEDILCVLESPATGGIGKLMNQVAKIQSLTIWSCFLSSFLKLSKILNLFNTSIYFIEIFAKSSLDWRTESLTQVNPQGRKQEVCNLDGFSEASWHPIQIFDCWASTWKFEKCLKLPYIYYGEENHETN